MKTSESSGVSKKSSGELPLDKGHPRFQPLDRFAWFVASHLCKGGPQLKTTRPDCVLLPDWIDYWTCTRDSAKFAMSFDRSQDRPCCNSSIQNLHLPAIEYSLVTLAAFHAEPQIDQSGIAPEFWVAVSLENRLRYFAASSAWPTLSSNSASSLIAARWNGSRVRICL